jgi:hypothetical protein
MSLSFPASRDELVRAAGLEKKQLRAFLKNTLSVTAGVFQHTLQLGVSPAAGSYSGTSKAGIQVTGGNAPSIGGLIGFSPVPAGDTHRIEKASIESAGANGHGILIGFDLCAFYRDFDLTTNAAQAASGAANIIPARRDYADFMFGEIEVALSAGVGSFTVGYTNQDGTAGRTSGSVSPSASSAVGRVAHAHWMIPFQGPDRGAKSVQNVTTSGVTFTTGKMTIVLGRLLFMVVIPATTQGKEIDFTAPPTLPKLPDDTALSFLWAPGTTAAPTLMGAIETAHG